MPMSWEREDKAEEVLFTDFIGCKIKRKRLHSYWLTQFIDCKHNPIFFLTLDTVQDCLECDQTVHKLTINHKLFFSFNAVNLSQL